MQPTISEEQKRLNKELHSERPDFGSKGGAGHQNVIKAIARYQKLKVIDSVLDYGTGKGAFPKALQKSLPDLKVSGYDPAVETFSSRPTEGHDLVTCFDVLEHVERNSLAAVLEDIRSLSRRAVFLQVDLQPAIKRLSSGRNAHIMLAPADWWVAQVASHFLIQGSFPIYHRNGTIQKIAIVATNNYKESLFVWSLLTKLQSNPPLIQGGYLEAPLQGEKAKKKKS